MKKELSTEEIYFLARVKKIEVDQLTKLKEMLDPKRVRSILIRYEYKERAKGNKIPKRHIIDLLMKKYGASRSYIESIVYEKFVNSRLKECIQCGKKTSYYRWVKYDGLCRFCVNENTIRKFKDGRNRDD